MNTWTLLPDLPDTSNPVRDVEHEQEQAMLEKIGHRLYERLCELEDNDHD